MSKNTNLSFLTDYITADITNGRIGINNASPTVAFDVVGATKITGNVGISGSPSNGLIPGLVIGDGTDNKGITLFGTTTTQQNIAFTDTANSQQGLIQYDHSGDYMRFFTATTERMRITSAGNVGIGTSSPAEKLEVNGNVKAVGAFVRDSGNIFVGSYVTVFTMDTSSSKVYLLQLVPTDSAANTSYRLFGVVQANTAAGSSGYAFISLASQTMDVQFVGAAIQVRITNGQGYNFKWSITQLC